MFSKRVTTETFPNRSDSVAVKIFARLPIADVQILIDRLASSIDFTLKHGLRFRSKISVHRSSHGHLRRRNTTCVEFQAVKHLRCLRVLPVEFDVRCSLERDASGSLDSTILSPYHREPSCHLAHGTAWDFERHAPGRCFSHWLALTSDSESLE